MRPSTEIIRTLSADWKLGNPLRPVFSSVWSRFLEGPEDFREEALASSLEPVRWVETLETLVSREGVSKFINVGPSNTLTGWLFNSSKFAGVELHDGWDLLDQVEGHDISRQEWSTMSL
jgi:malonyl CoA-acyl carrier protein transacylase